MVFKGSGKGLYYSINGCRVVQTRKDFERMVWEKEEKNIERFCRR